jgi:hypothetical protein
MREMKRSDVMEIGSDKRGFEGERERYREGERRRMAIEMERER